MHVVDNVVLFSLSCYAGPLSAVGGLDIAVVNSLAHLTWEPPITLDITLTEPDIEGYCVDIRRSNVMVHSECRITETRYSYTTLLDNECSNYAFNVIPVNVVGNGTSKAIMSVNKPSKIYFW